MLLVTPIVALVIVGFVAAALTPTLLSKHPLVLIALEARNRNLILTASRVDLLPFVAVATLRRLLTDPLYYLLGRFYGDRAVRWLEKDAGGGAFIRMVEQLFRKAAYPMVFFFPGAVVCALAGETGMRPAVFLALNILGTITVVIALRLFTGTIEGPVDAIQRFNDRNFKWLTIVTIVIVILYVLVQRSMGKAEVQSIDEIQEELEGDEGAAGADQSG